MTKSELNRRSLLKSAALSAALAAPTAPLARAQETKPPSRPDEINRRGQPMGNGTFSQARLRRMRDTMAGHVSRGAVPGLVTLISRRGEVHVDAIGMKAVGGSDPIRRDTISASPR